MRVAKTDLPGVVIIKPDVHRDDRGFFLEVFHQVHYADKQFTDLAPGISEIVQINHSRSGRNTLRGLHYQEPNAQGKLVWVVSGEVLDVAVDIRRGSETFGHWVAVPIDAKDHEQVWVPAGFAHGFVVRSESAEVMYACTAPYDEENEHCIRWDDPDIGIRWNVEEPILSERDRSAPSLSEATVLLKAT